MKQRKIYGVIAAEASSIEQRQILNGVIATAQAHNIDIAVITNIYNPYDENDRDYKEFFTENRIYELILSPELDGLILIAESFTNKHLQGVMLETLKKRLDLPLIIISMYSPELDLPNATFINTSDINDMFEITSHMIEEHGFTKIDILTGFTGNPAAEDRVQGYRRALEEHGLTFEPERVHWGDFWTTSGDQLAKDYISGKFPLPQALVCVNDYMAFGLLDALAVSPIRVPEDLAVTGYENVNERIYHTPLLSTYQRNRSELGMQAVMMLEDPAHVFESPRGTWVAGASCGCTTDPEIINSELNWIRTRINHEYWTSYSNMEMKLTLCESLEEFIAEMTKHLFLVRYASDILLCLFEKWHTDENCSMEHDRLSFRSIAGWRQEEPMKNCTPFQLSEMMYGPPCAYYFTPLFFRKRLMGLNVLRYDHPDCFDPVYRDWLKGVANGLEFLRMKNDIQYLIRRRSDSGTYDSVTGLLRQTAFLRELSAAISHAAPEDKMLLLTLRSSFTPTELHLQTESERITAAKAVAAAMQSAVRGMGQMFCGLPAQGCYVIAGIGKYTDEAVAELTELLHVYLLYSADAFTTTVPDSFRITAQQYALDGIKPEKILAAVTDEMKQVHPPAFTSDDLQLLRLRIRLYHDFEEQPSAEDCCRILCFSEGYFRTRYKILFGVSYHQDCIHARISYAKFLLLTTQLSVSAIAAQCGYREDNYFLRQFRRETGLTPNQFRKILPANARGES